MLNIVNYAWKNITEKNEIVENVWPANSCTLFTFRPIASKQLNSLTTIDTTSWLAGAVVTHSIRVQEVPGSIPGSGKAFYIWFFVVVVVFFCPKTHYLSQHFAILFAMLIYLVYLTYCKICDRLQGYKDTDLASLTKFETWYI